MFIIGKYVKIRSKNMGPTYYFLSSRCQKVKNITKMFLFTFWCHFYVFKPDLRNKYLIQLYVWLIFWKRYLLNLITLGVYAKRWPKCARISTQKLITPKIWFMIFFLILTVRRPFHRNGLKWRKEELNKRVESATSGYFATGDFLQCIYSVLVARIM